MHLLRVLLLLQLTNNYIASYNIASTFCGASFLVIFIVLIPPLILLLYCACKNVYHVYLQLHYCY